MPKTIRIACQAYWRWTTSGPKWHVFAGLLAPILALLTLVAMGDDETRHWLCSGNDETVEGPVNPDLDEAWEEFATAT